MRTIEQAAREAVQGSDESLWQACMEKHGGYPGIALSFGQGEKLCEQLIRSMSPEERKLYGIEEGIK